MNSKKILAGIFAGAALTVLSACLMPIGDGEDLGPSGDVLPPDTTFQIVFDEVFSVAGCTGCHGTFPTGDALRLNNATNAMATLFGEDGVNRFTTTAQDLSPRWRIYRTSDTTGIADSSFLYQKVSSDNPKNGTRMPQNGDALTANQIKVIRRWIETGARF